MNILNTCFNVGRLVKLLSRNPWHYNLMIREFSYHHELQSSFDVLDIMKELGVAPDLYTYRALMDSCGRCNEPSKAAVVFEVCPSCLKLREFDAVNPPAFIEPWLVSLKHSMLWTLRVATNQSPNECAWLLYDSS